MISGTVLYLFLLPALRGTPPPYFLCNCETVKTMTL